MVPFSSLCQCRFLDIYSKRKQKYKHILANNQIKRVRRRQTLVKREHGLQEKSLVLNFLLCLLFSELKDLCGALCRPIIIVTYYN